MLLFPPSIVSPGGISSSLCPQCLQQPLVQSRCLTPVGELTQGNRRWIKGILGHEGQLGGHGKCGQVGPGSGRSVALLITGADLLAGWASMPFSVRSG